MIILLSFLFSLATVAQSNKYHTEVWQLKSLKKIGGNKVEVFGNPEIIKTEIGKAIKFDGIDDRILVDKNPIGGAAEYTVEVIFKPDPAYDISDQPRFVHFQDPGDPSEKRVMIELRLTPANEWYLDGYMLTDAGERTLQNKNLTHPVGKWHHAALTYKDNTFKTYVNGIEEISGTVSYKEMLVNKTGKTSIGGRMDKRNYYSGMVKSLKITHKALEPKDFTLINSNK
jgi:hypothetical protein